ncbi:heavy-metal-associated domain-containing protein [Sphingomonas hankyongi]|uniref:Heavy-metal-associated domain-containing protein n=1 Tax=Sphingomonas hankyongi TaxID=2908209 RepID=A0ABT0S3X1_9SPHN|nr:heavy-metal-associated domain-containing protein [Sphingomonas hankyongi]MCL6730569.1 heavy-metal-associated domain-containing protein [Sphingomonas hankyongi]
MLRRRLAVSLLLLLLTLGLAGALYAQLETADRGILPIDSSGTLEITGIHVDVGGPDAQSARFAGWRVAQRQGFRMLYAKMRGVPPQEAPNLPDATLDDIVSSINVEREQIGPNRYIADLGILFDRARAAQYLGVEGGEVQRSVPMLLIPITVTAGTSTSVELRNAWQRAWAQFRTSQSPIDYVRVSGLGADPMLVNASQTIRPGRGWWRNIIDYYGAADILVAEVQVQRLYPGGPARARFIARHGPDNEIVGGFTLTAANSDALPQMMAEGVRRMDELFGNALAAGMLVRDSSLDLPPPPVLELPLEAPVAAVAAPANAYQVQISGDVNMYNFAMAHLRTLPGIESATPQQINPGGTSYVLVSYRGGISSLAAALSARGWVAEASGTVVRVRSGSEKPPPIPQPPAPQAPPPSTPAQPPPASNQVSGAE